VVHSKLAWQSKLVLLAVYPAVAADIVLETRWWATEVPNVCIWTVGLSALLGLIAWQTRSADAGAALAGTAITASLMFGTATVPYLPWQTGLIPVLAVLLLTSLATRLGRRRKEQMGTAESRKGRNAAQVAANLGAAAVLATEPAESWLLSLGWVGFSHLPTAAVFVPSLAALSEAAADTVSSELGQVLSGHPRMITTLRRVEAGTDGAISLGGTLAGILAAGAVAAAGTYAFRGDWLILAAAWGGGVFGLFFDSLSGATLERQGLLNNDAVNFLSTLSAAAFSLLLLGYLPRLAHY
jgi:uncharacterized protein (TIGR00297 family)